MNQECPSKREQIVLQSKGSKNRCIGSNILWIGMVFPHPWIYNATGTQSVSKLLAVLIATTVYLISSEVYLCLKDLLEDVKVSQLYYKCSCQESHLNPIPGIPNKHN